MKKNDFISRILSTIDANTEKPEKFLRVQNDVESNLRNTLKTLYDFTWKKTFECKVNNNTNNNVCTLPELLIEDVDEENIWQQIELQNESVILDLIVDIANISVKNSLLKVSVTRQKNYYNDDDNGSNHNKNQEKKISHFNKNFSDNDQEMDLDDEIDKKIQKNNKKYKRNKPSIVDDKFFKLNELDEFLAIEDKKELKNTPDSNSDKDSDQESIDLFEFENYSIDDYDDNVRNLKYADFFDSPESDNNDNGVNKNIITQNKLKSNNYHYSDDDDDDAKSEKRRIVKEINGKNKRVKFNIDTHSVSISDSDSDSDSNNSNVTEKNNMKLEIKSSLDCRIERAEKKITKLETENVEEKPWSLKGEIKGDSRPSNTLLEDYFDYDVGLRPAPVMTETNNLKLEEIIKQRIKDNAWDDVQRKFKPIETPIEYKKKLAMDQEKSKKSLAEIYEDAYLKQKQALDPDSQEHQEEESKEFKEIREGIQLLIQKLDALSNYHCTPKQVQPDVKIISNLPAINMEEVAPVATADATLLAPEEVQVKKRGDLIGESERTDTDKNRQRRKKKKVQKLKQKAMEVKEKSIVNNKKQSKLVNNLLIKKLTTDRNIKKIHLTNIKTSKSSTDFFTKLQEHSDNRSAYKSKIDKKKIKNSSAIKYKL